MSIRNQFLFFLVLALAALFMMAGGCAYPPPPGLTRDMISSLNECVPLCPDGTHPVQAKRVYDRVNAFALLDCGCLKDHPEPQPSLERRSNEQVQSADAR